MDFALSLETLQQRTLPIGKLMDESNYIEAKLRQGPYSTIWRKPSLGQVDFPNHSQLRVSVMTICAKEALKWTAIGASAGAAVGAFAGTCSQGKKGAQPGAALGAGAGGVAGLVYGCFKAKVKGEFIIERSEEYTAWKQGLTQTQYRLFLNTIKRYIDEGCVKQLTDPNDSLIDPISLDLITFPVLSPHGQVYDKECIELALDKGSRGTDPLGLPLYEKKDLVYASNFAEGAIKTYKDVLNRLDRTPSDDNRIFQIGIELLLEQYQRDYKAVTWEVISELTADLIREGANKEQRKRCLTFYRNYCRV